MSEPTATSPRALALLIGINHYPHLEPRYQLEGCVNDVAAISQVLKTKLPNITDNITCLTSTDASNTSEKKPTRDNILQALEDLVIQARQKDVVIICYSGHGSRMENPTKHTGWNETIVPCDRGVSPDITDDELHGILLRLTSKTENVTLIIDSCHSGSITRDPFGARSRFVPPDAGLVATVEPTPSASNVPSRAESGKERQGPSGWLPFNRKYVLLAGCREDESSYEYAAAAGAESGGKPIMQGAWTFHLCQALCSALPGDTYRDVFEKTSPLVTSVRQHQHPQLEGSPDRELFGTKEIVASPFVSVGAYDPSSKTFTLAAGAAMGVTEKSQWGVYPSGTRKPDEEKKNRLVLLEISEVGVTTSRAKVVDGDVTGVKAGARAFEEAHHFGEMRLRVFVQGPPQVPPEFKEQFTLLQQLLNITDKNRGLLRQALDDTEADVKVHLLLPRPGVKEGDPLPQVPSIEEALWAVVGKDGKLCMPCHGVTLHETNLVHENLEKMARFKQGLLIENKEADNALKGKIEFHLTRKKPDSDTWEKMESPSQEVGILHVIEGEQMGGRITNHHNKVVYVFVLEFGEDGTVNILFPAAGASEPLEPGKTVTFGDDFYPLQISTHFKKMCDKLPGSDVFAEPEETLKVFAMSKPADFSPLKQENYKHVSRDDKTPPGSNTALGRLLTMALAGRGDRLLVPRSVSDELWITVQHSFVLLPAGHETPLPPLSAHPLLPVTTPSGALTQPKSIKLRLKLKESGKDEVVELILDTLTLENLKTAIAREFDRQPQEITRIWYSRHGTRFEIRARLQNPNHDVEKLRDGGVDLLEVEFQSPQ